MITEQSSNLRETEGREGGLETSHVSTSDDSDARFKCKERERESRFGFFCFLFCSVCLRITSLDLGPTTDEFLLSFSYLLTTASTYPLSLSVFLLGFIKWAYTY